MNNDYVELPAWLFGTLVHITQLCTVSAKAKTIRVAKGPYEVLLRRIFVCQPEQNICPFSTLKVISDMFPGLQYKNEYSQLPVAVRRYAGKIIAYCKNWREWNKNELSEESISLLSNLKQKDIEFMKNGNIFLYPYQEELDDVGKMCDLVWDVLGQIIYTAFKQVISKDETIMKISLKTLIRFRTYVNLPPDQLRQITQKSLAINPDEEADAKQSIFGRMITEELDSLFIKKKKKLLMKKDIPKEFTMQCVTTLETVFDIPVQDNIRIETVPREFELMTSNSM